MYTFGNIFCYGNLEIGDPAKMFYRDQIETFTSKSEIKLTGNADEMFSYTGAFKSK